MNMNMNMNKQTICNYLLDLDMATPLTQYLTKISDRDFMQLPDLLFEEADSIQEHLLMQILSYAKDSLFGQEHGFADIKNIEDFRNRVPILSWNDYEPCVEQLIEGKADVLFPGKATFFTVTSGTSGKEKYIPDSAMSAFSRGLILRFRLLYLLKQVPNLLENKLLPLTNAPTLSKTPSGIPCGTASGLTLGQSGLERLMAYPSFLLMNSDKKSADYLLMRFAIEQENVLAVVGNNAARMTGLIRLAEENKEDIIHDIEQGTIRENLILDPGIRSDVEKFLKPNPERAAVLRTLLAEGKPFIPANYWTKMGLAIFWLASSLGHYVDELRPYFAPSVRFMDAGYGSSEAKFNIPMEPEEKSGALSTATSFYEFLPTEGGEPLLAHQLKIGKEYELVVTTWGGLYRYNMKDIVRVDGFIGNTPKIEFVRKSSELLNLASEKIPATAVNDCVRDYLKGKGIDVRQVQIYPDLVRRRYVCYVEPMAGTFTVFPGWEEEVNVILAEHFLAYDLFVYEQKVMRPMVLVPMKEGWQESLYAKKLKPGITKSQLKLPLLILEPADESWKAQ